MPENDERPGVKKMSEDKEYGIKEEDSFKIEHSGRSSVTV